MKLLSNIVDSLNPSAVNEVTQDINSNHALRWLSVKSAATDDLYQKVQF